MEYAEHICQGGAHLSPWGSDKKEVTFPSSWWKQLGPAGGSQLARNTTLSAAWSVWLAESVHILWRTACALSQLSGAMSQPVTRECVSLSQPYEWSCWSNFQKSLGNVEFHSSWLKQPAGGSQLETNTYNVVSRFIRVVGWERSHPLTHSLRTFATECSMSQPVTRECVSLSQPYAWSCWSSFQQSHDNVLRLRYCKV
jgi:hypothetical protein